MSKVLNYKGSLLKRETALQKKGDNVVIIPDDTEFVAFSPKKGDTSEKEEVQEEAFSETPQEAAEREAHEIVEKAQREAKEITDKAALQAADIKKAAKQSGYDEGFASKTDAISAVLTEAVATLNKIKSEQESFVEKYSSELGTLAIEIAERILKHRLEIDPMAMCDMSESAMSSLKEAKWAVLTISNELVPLVELLQSELPEKYPSVASIEVVGGQLPKGALTIDSPQGIIDASIDVQLKNLAQRFAQIERKRDII